MNTGNKESDLVTGVLLYAMRCLAEGDLAALRTMRFGPREIEALRALNLADLYRVGSLQAHCLHITLDREVFWPMLANLCSRRQSEELQRDLIQADAPLEMMRSLFGVSAREYTRLRRVLAVAPAVGRPPEPDEETSHRLWRALATRLESIRSDELDPAEYLALHQESGASMRAVWNHVQRWLQYGDVYKSSTVVQSSPAASSRPRVASG